MRYDNEYRRKVYKYIYVPVYKSHYIVLSCAELLLQR